MGGQRILDSSFRDPSGFLFRRNGILFRQVNHSYREHYEYLRASGLLKQLIEAGLLIPHEEVDEPPAGRGRSLCVIKPQPLQFVSYPYEWSFSQLKDAALVTVQIQRMAMKHGMSLKDASAYNIQFHKGRPLLIDTLSFEIHEEGRPWTAYRQFCQHFLAPLAVMAYRDFRIGQLLRVFIDGLPLDLASDLLPLRTRLRFSLLSHVHLHASAQRRYADQGKNPAAQRKVSISRRALHALVDNLGACVSSLKWDPSGTEWVEYYGEEHQYSDPALEDKRSRVCDFLDRARPSTVWDLGANTGMFSRLASDRGIATLAFDADYAAVELGYLNCRQRGEEKLLPLVMDLTNPSPALGWSNKERMSLLERGPADAAFALALIHHLAISNNVPLPHLARFFASLCTWLIIEWVPKEDPQVQRLLATREDVFPDYHRDGFEQAFGSVFTTEDAVDITGSQRRLYLLKKRD